MKRHEFMMLLGSAAVWPVAAHAQQAVTVPSIGVLMPLTETDSKGQVRQAAFLKGLKETGYVDGQNVMIQYRWTAAQYDQLPVLAADLVRRRVAVIVAPGSAPAALAVKAATKTIPIVFSTNGDPVKLGLVASLNRPGGNITGVSYLNSELGAKRLELLKTAKTLGLIVPASLLTRADEVIE